MYWPVMKYLPVTRVNEKSTQIGYRNTERDILLATANIIPNASTTRLYFVCLFFLLHDIWGRVCYSVRFLE